MLPTCIFFQLIKKLIFLYVNTFVKLYKLLSCYKQFKEFDKYKECNSVNFKLNKYKFLNVTSGKVGCPGWIFNSLVKSFQHCFLYKDIYANHADKLHYQK